MKKIFLVFVILCFIGCSEETIQSERVNAKQNVWNKTPDEAMHIQTLKVNFTKAEEDFHRKILRLSTNEFDDIRIKSTESELEEFAISFLIEESKYLLLENGYNENQLEREFENEEIKLIHQALKVYGAKINSNQ